MLYKCKCINIFFNSYLSKLTDQITALLVPFFLPHLLEQNGWPLTRSPAPHRTRRGPGSAGTRHHLPLLTWDPSWTLAVWLHNHLRGDTWRERDCVTTSDFTVSSWVSSPATYPSWQHQEGWGWWRGLVSSRQWVIWRWAWGSPPRTSTPRWCHSGRCTRLTCSSGALKVTSRHASWGGYCSLLWPAHCPSRPPSPGTHTAAYSSSWLGRNPFKHVKVDGLRHIGLGTGC